MRFMETYNLCLASIVRRCCAHISISKPDCLKTPPNILQDRLQHVGISYTTLKVLSLAANFFNQGVHRESVHQFRENQA